MSSDKNKTLQRTIYGHFSANRFDEVLELCGADVVVEMIALGQIHKGHGGFREFMMGFKNAFPDLSIEIRSQVSDDDRIAAEFTAIGTHSGPLATPGGPIPATGRKVTFTVCEVWDVKNGKLVGLRNYQDIGSVLRQIGAG